MSSSRRILLAVLVLGLGLGWALLARSKPGGFHPMGASCAECHLAGEHADAKTASLLTASQETLCRRCHPGAVEASHPSGFHPSRKLPGEYPLDFKSDLTCSTCHQVHGEHPGRMRGERRGRALCRACHAEAFFREMRDQGESIVASGHLDALADASKMKLDPYSAQCMGCHDDKGDGPPVKVEGRGLLRHGSGRVNHPIGVRYEAYQSYGGFRAASRVAREVLMPGGRVGCVSCHRGYSERHGALVRSNKGSALCFECHDL